jgi:AraC-like DNA-binding protein
MDSQIPRYQLQISQTGQDLFMIKSADAGLDLYSMYHGPHTHDYNCLSFLYEGSTEHSADLKWSKTEAPAILLLDVDQVHTHASTKDCKIIYICFSPDFLHRGHMKSAQCIDSVFSQPVVHLSACQLQEMDTYIQLIFKEQEKGSRQDIRIISSLLDIILILTLKFSEFSEPAPYDHKKKELYLRFKSVLKTHFKMYHQVNYYASALQVGTDKLTEVIRMYTGRSPKQLIDERLIAEAKRLLYWSDLRAKEVAWELGFETDAYFNRFFKKHMAITPKEFQKSKS